MRKANARFFVLIASGFCLGLFFASLAFTVAPAAGILPAAAFAAACLFSMFVFGKKVVFAFLAAACAAGFLLGYADFAPYTEEEFPESVYTVDARIENAVYYEDGTRLVLSDAEIVRSERQTRYKISLYVEGEGKFSAGDRIAFTAKLTRGDALREGSLDGSPIAEGVKYYAYLGEYDTYYIAAGSPDLFERANGFLYDALRAGLGKDFPVAFALLTGETAYIDAEVLQNFRFAGVAHIFAVSGLHIGFLAAALDFLFRRLPLPRAVKNIVTLAALFFYAGVCGFTPSSLRAAIMCAVLLTAKSCGFKYDMLSSAAFSAVAVCALSPAQFFTAGFRLSYAAVLGIAVLSPRFSSLLKRLPRKLASPLAVTLSAQIGTFPVSAYYFSYLPALAAPLNLLIVPFVSVLFVLLLAGALLAGVFSPRVMLFLPKYLLRFLTETTMLADFGAVAATGLCVTAAAALLLYYPLVFLAAGFVRMKERALRLSCVVLSSLFAACAAAVSVTEFSAAEIRLVSEDGFNAVCIGFEGEELIVVCEAEGLFSAADARYFLESRCSGGAVWFFADENIDVVAAYDILEEIYPAKKVCYTGALDPAVAERVFGKERGFFERTGKTDFAGITLYGNGAQAAFTVNGRSVLIDCGAADTDGGYDLVVAASFTEDYAPPAGTASASFAADGENFACKIYESELKRL